LHGYTDIREWGKTERNKALGIGVDGTRLKPDVRLRIALNWLTIGSSDRFLESTSVDLRVF
jgi:hypothetical protein